MTAQILWDDIIEGQEIGPVVRHPTSQQLVKYAGASGDYYQIHYDKDFAQGTGLEDIILHGALKKRLPWFIGNGLDGPARQLATLVLPVSRYGHPRSAHYGPWSGDQQVPGQRGLFGRLRDLVGERSGPAHHAGACHGGSAQKLTRATVAPKFTAPRGKAIG